MKSIFVEEDSLLRDKSFCTMTSLTKIVFRLLLLGIVLLIATAYHLSSNVAHTYNAEKNFVELRISRHRRATKPATTRYCKSNQYYDQEEGRCLGVPGGGKVLHIENERSCGVNVLKPHCTSSLYYHICKRDRSILAQCTNKQIFDNRLQRCVLSTSNPSTIRPDDHTYYDHVKAPSCTKPGRFSIPDYCFMYYVCETNGHRLYQSIFKCPRGTGYQADREICAAISDCENNDSGNSTVCVADAPDENVESLNLDDVTEENIETTSETSKESKIVNENDSAIKGEENVNFKSYDDTSTTPVSVTYDSSIDNYEDNNNSTDKALSNNTNTLSTRANENGLDDIGEMSTPNPTMNPIESVQEAPDKVPNEEDELSTTEFDKDASHFVTTSIRPTEPEYTTNTNLNSNLDSEIIDNTSSPKSDEEKQDNIMEQHKGDDETATLSNSNTTPTDQDPISKIDEEVQDATTEQYKNNEESSHHSIVEAIKQDSTSRISNISESSSDMAPTLGEETDGVTTEQYRYIEDSSVTSPYLNTEVINQDPTSKINNTTEFLSSSDMPLEIDEKMQDVTTEQYNNNESIEQDQRVNNMSESSLTSGMPPVLNEETDDVTTEQNRNYERTITLPDSKSESVDQTSMSTLSDIPPTVDSLNNDFNTPLSTSTPATLSPQAAVDDDEHTTEELAESSLMHDKSADADLHAPDEVENVSTPYSLEHTDAASDSIPTTSSSLTLEHATEIADTATEMNIADTTPEIQDSPTSDTNIAMQNDEDSTKASFASSTEQDAPITNSDIS